MELERIMLESVFIVLATFLVYFHTFKNDLVIDDVRRRREVEAGAFSSKRWQRNLYQRLYGFGTLAYKNKDGKWKTDAKLDHYLSTAIFACIGVTMYWAFLPIAGEFVALAAALLYMVNPINTQISIWANGRRYALIVWMTLGMLIFGPWSLMVLFPFVMLFHTTAMLAPLLFGPAWAMMIFPMIMFAWPQLKKRIDKRQKVIFGEELNQFHLRKLIPIVKTYGFFVFKMVFPYRTFMIYPHMRYWGLTKEGNKNANSPNVYFWFGVAMLALSGVALVYLWPTPQLFYFGAFMVLGVLQWCGFITVTQHFADRYVSVANVFMMFFVAYFVKMFAGPYALTVLVGLGAFYLTTMFVTSKMYGNMNYFWAYHFFFDAPGPACREFKAAFHLKTRDPLAAWPVVKDGLELNPDDFKLNMLAANCMALLQDHGSCIMYLKHAKKHVYINQDKIYVDVVNGIFGMDLAKEVADIEAKVSKRPTDQRKKITDLHRLLNTDITEAEIAEENAVPVGGKSK